MKDGGRVLHDGSTLGTPQPLEVEVDTPAADHAADMLIEPAAAAVDASHAFQSQIDALRKSEQAQRQPLTVEQTIDRMQLPDPIKTWVKDHPEYVTDARKNALIQKLHWDIVEDEGHAPYSAPYIASMERHLGLSGAAPAAKHSLGRPVADDYADSGRGRIVSAPVSRDPMGAGGGSYNERPGRVTLSAQQIEAAKIAGVDLKTYAEQVLKLRERKQSGDYGGSP